MGNTNVIEVHGLSRVYRLKSGEEVYWQKEVFKTGEKTYPSGTIYIPAAESTAEMIKQIAGETGLDFDATDIRPQGESLALRPMRVGLWDRYGGSMDSGWIRWIFEQFEFDFELVYSQTLDAGNLIQKFDVLIFVNRAIPPRNPDPATRYRSYSSPDPKTIPKEYHYMLGSVTVKKTIPQLERFLEQGGTILTIGSSADLAYYLNLPISNALIEKSPEGKENPFPSEKYFIPGSILRVRVDNSHPIAYGMPEDVDVYFNRSPVFKLLPEPTKQTIRPVAWFETDAALRSGWAKGQHYLKGGVTVLEASVGKGKLFIFGPEITFRAQSHGTFKFLFNGLYYGGAESLNWQK